jgi:kinesin family protein 11
MNYILQANIYTVSITVHMKETSAVGDDLFKVEVGMINQSSLTLGCVINGLVDWSAHVPYR